MLTNHARSVRLTVAGGRVVRRRDVLRTFCAGGLAAGAASWTDVLTSRADELRRRGMSCILLWMPGGPSQFETFDPKPEHANGGETKAIDTVVPGVRISENLPHLAQVADRLAIIRSMSTKEGDHGRGTHLMHTASLPLGGIQYPTLGAVAAHEIEADDCQLPAFVQIGGGNNGGAGAGFLGTQYDAFPVPGATRPPENVRLATDADRFRNRVDLMGRLQTASHRRSGDGPNEHVQLYQNASRMILSPQMQAFNIEEEPASVREAYGWNSASTPNANDANARRNPTGAAGNDFRRSQFAAECILTRRLIESGVTFVELGVRAWDTHQDNFNACRGLCSVLDRPYAALLTDLAERGLLDKTLVIWTGEFGRTPRINPNGGRDHFPRAFSAVLAGGGVRGGQVIGSTTLAGDEVADRPVSEKDLFQTIYKSLGIDAAKQHMTPIGRPIRYVEGGAPIDEAFG